MKSTRIFSARSGPAAHNHQCNATGIVALFKFAGAQTRAQEYGLREVSRDIALAVQRAVSSACRLGCGVIRKYGLMAT